MNLLQKTTNIFLIFFLFQIEAHGFGKKRPAPEISPPREETPSATLNWSALSIESARSVDQYYSRYKELLKIRSPDRTPTDQCALELTDKTPHFAHSIGFFIRELLKDQKLKMNSIGSLYGVPTQESNTAVSLASHPMCVHTATTLRTTLGKSIPEQTITKINQVAAQYNSYFESMKSDLPETRKKAQDNLFQFWFKTFACLAYTESLTTADSARSYELASLHGPADYDKPAGVKFYYDAQQSSPDSRLNIGLFQFSPKAGGNISPCIEAWNDRSPSCQVLKNETKAELVKILGSPYQNFNSFCGIHKVLQTFHVQVNTTQESHTSPHNKRVQPADRCVTLHVRSGYAYNHYGPFQNTTGTNLESLLNCMMSE